MNDDLIPKGVHQITVAVAYAVGTFMQATTHKSFVFSAWLGIISFFIVIGVYTLANLIIERLEQRNEP